MRLLLPPLLSCAAAAATARAQVLPGAGARCGGLGSPAGSCPGGQCCSAEGFCGTDGSFCSGSQCQIEFSDSCDSFFGPPGPDTDGIPRPKVGNVPYGTLITACSQAGTMALTFDDGPGQYTSQMLDLLDELHVQATFFIAGKNQGKSRADDPATSWPAILRRMHGAGHQLASHTFTHRSLNGLVGSETALRVRRTEIMFNEMVFRNVFGWFPTYLRPPFLECGQECLDFLGERGYHVISANVDTKDYEHDDPVGIAESRRLFSAGVSDSAAGNGYIVLAHDVHYQTVATLTRFMVSEARRLGYRLVTVGECLGDPRENWYRQAPAGGPRAYARPPYRPAPAPVSISSNGQCGPAVRAACQRDGYAPCCSQYGFCGGSGEYCGMGCQPQYGKCNPSS